MSSSLSLASKPQITHTTTPPPPASTTTIYPPITHSLSPTWFTWVKITAYEIHHVLRLAPGNFATLSHCTSSAADGPPPVLYHYINHPIQYVYLAGIVVSVEGFNPKYYIFILDDSSGETLEVVYPRPAGGSMMDGTGTGPTTVHQQTDATPAAATTKLDVEEVEIHQLLSKLEVGTSLKVKGHITAFRSNRQLRLDRVHVVRDANEEAKFWSSMKGFHDKVLSKPWLLSERDIANAKADANKKVDEEDAQVARRRERARVRARIEDAQKRKLERRWEREERIREREAQKARREGEEVMKSIRRRREMRRGAG